MVLKHAPLGEINLPSVASSAIIPRCRRNRRSFRVGASPALSALPSVNIPEGSTSVASALREIREICVKLIICESISCLSCHPWEKIIRERCASARPASPLSLGEGWGEAPYSIASDEMRFSVDCQPTANSQKLSAASSGA